MRIVGLTGGIASGKTIVSGLLRDSGFPVIDCDVIARDVVKPGRWGWRRVVKAFGNTVLLPDGNLNRELLGAMIFKDAKLRAKLNAATHLPVFVALIKQIIIAWLQHVPILVVDMPLLFESKVEKWFHPVVLVWCEEESQIQRLMDRDGCDEDTAKSKIQAQMPMDIKAEKATLLINNSSTKSNTKVQVKDFTATLKRERIVSYCFTPAALAINMYLALLLVRYIERWTLL